MAKEYKEEIHFYDLDGNKDVFYTERNTLNNNQMFWFKNKSAMFSGTVRDAKAWANHIRDNLKLVEDE
jgi:hypothetical protein